MSEENDIIADGLNEVSKHLEEVYGAQGKDALDRILGALKRQAETEAKRAKDAATIGIKRARIGIPLVWQQAGTETYHGMTLREALDKSDEDGFTGNIGEYVDDSMQVDWDEIARENPHIPPEEIKQLRMEMGS